MIAMSFRTFKIKFLVFTLSNLLSVRDLVDTQQLIFPTKIILLSNYKNKQTDQKTSQNYKYAMCLY